MFYRVERSCWIMVVLNERLDQLIGDCAFSWGRGINVNSILSVEKYPRAFKSVYATSGIS